MVSIALITPALRKLKVLLIGTRRLFGCPIYDFARQDKAADLWQQIQPGYGLKTWPN